MLGTLIIKKKIRSAFDSLSQRDVPKFISDWAEDAAFIYPPAVSVGGKTEGKRAIEKWFEKFVEQFPKVNFKVKNVCVENIFDFTGTNVAAAEWDIT